MHQHLCARRAGAGLSIHLLCATAVQTIGLAAVESLRWVDEIPAADAPPNLLPDLHSIHLRTNGLRILITDLLFTGEPAVPLRALGQGHGSSIVLCPFAPEEAAPTWAGPCDFLDVESGHRESRHIDAPVMRRYRAAYDIHFQRWKEQTARFRTPLARIPAIGSLNDALAVGALPTGAVEVSNQ